MGNTSIKDVVWIIIWVIVFITGTMMFVYQYDPLLEVSKFTGIILIITGSYFLGAQAMKTYYPQQNHVSRNNPPDPIKENKEESA